MLDINFPPEPVRLHFYADSSSHRGAHQYMVVGGFLVRENRVGEINNRIAELRKCPDGNQFRKFHYKEYRGGIKRENYFSLIDYCYHLIKEAQIHGYFIVCDFKEFDHHKSERGNSETSVNKLYWQLILNKLALPLGARCCFSIFPDQGDDSSQVVAFRENLCKVAYRQSRKHNSRFEWAQPNCVREIRPLFSHHSGLIQMADVIASVIAAKRNNRILTSSKGELVNYALDTSPRNGWFQSENISGYKLEIWDFKF